MSIIYFESDQAIEIHDVILDISNGLPGIKDPGQLKSVLYHIQNDDYYNSFEEKITHLVYSTVKFHMFYDGNKRTSIGLGAFFLNLNGYVYCTDTFIAEMENIVLWIAQDLIEKELLQRIITSIIDNNELNESVKLELALLI